MNRETCHLWSLDFSILLMLFLVMSSCLQNEPRRRPVKYLIPEGYVGWVKIDFGSPNAPVLPLEQDHFVARIPPSGQLQTSSDIKYGWAKDEYYYYRDDTREQLKQTGWGGGGMIGEGFNGTGLDGDNNVKQTFLQFFVGTGDEYKKHVGPPGIQKPGPVER